MAELMTVDPYLPEPAYRQLAAILAAPTEPFHADFAPAHVQFDLVQLYLYVHRVAGLAPGVYRPWPEHGKLEQIRSGDQRLIAAALSLQQDLAGNACVAFSMIADLDRAATAAGDRGYRHAHFLAGAIGHRLYLAAEALGVSQQSGKTGGAGAFGHRLLDLDQRDDGAHNRQDPTLLLVAFGAGMGFSAVSPWPNAGVSATTFNIATGLYLIVLAMLFAIPTLSGHAREPKKDDKKPAAKKDDKKPEPKKDDKKPEPKKEDKKPAPKKDDKKPEPKKDDKKKQ